MHEWQPVAKYALVYSVFEYIKIKIFYELSAQIQISAAAGVSTTGNL